MTALLVALGAGTGAVLRFTTATRLDSARFPWGTWLVNVVGSFALGALSGAGVGGDDLALVGTGLCGGFTTWSSFALQTHQRGPRRGAGYAIATLAVALAACTLGFVVGQA